MCYSASRKRLYIHQLQVKRSCKIGEDGQPRTQCDGMDCQVVFIDQPRFYQASHQARTPSARIGLPGSALSLLIPSARSPSKIRAWAQEAAAGDCSAVVVCSGWLPLHPFLVKSALGISFIGSAKGPLAVGQ
jgi:hypothetical protein